MIALSIVLTPRSENPDRGVMGVKNYNLSYGEGE